MFYIEKRICETICIIKQICLLEQIGQGNITVYPMMKFPLC